MKRRTLSDWCLRADHHRLTPRRRGRPCKESARRHRLGVLETIESVGPHVGLPTIRGLFPGMPRCELIDLQASYRRHYQERNRLVVDQLVWTSPGRVWAVDHSDPIAEVDGSYRSLLAVRDLASGMQLAWLPVPDQTAETTVTVLTTLFEQHGAPLLLKSDNGSAFKSEAAARLLQRWDVIPLRSPPHTPQYNGSCEAGIGSMKTRTIYAAARDGNAACWTSAHLEIARRESNELHRSRHGRPTAAEIWNRRTAIRGEERSRLREKVDQYRLALLKKRFLDDPMNQVNEASLHRQAVRQALIQLGHLSVNRRSITLPLKSRTLAKIS